MAHTYSEAHVRHFTSPTTVYSGLDGHIVTATHSVPEEDLIVKLNEPWLCVGHHRSGDQFVRVLMDLSYSSTSPKPRCRIVTAESTTEVDWRPLSPQCLSQGVVSGSADDTDLHWWLNDSWHTPLTLTSHVLVVRVVWMEENRYALAMGCQDGTVRYVEVSVDDETAAWTIHVDRSILVDGPILALHLTLQKAVIGSSYVAQWDLRDSVDMIGESLVNDNVLVVVSTDDRVYVGTVEGQCRVYWQGQVEWTCQLPHPVHGVRVVDDGFHVWTRYTLHHFVGRPTTLYDAALARKRIKELIEASQRPPVEDTVVDSIRESSATEATDCAPNERQEVPTIATTQDDTASVVLDEAQTSPPNREMTQGVQSKIETESLT